MKKIVTILLMALFGISVYAEEIVLTPRDTPKTGTGNGWERTEIVEVRASIEDEVINIETGLATCGVTVTVYNSDSIDIYTSVSPMESKVHEFAVGTLPADDYTIEVQIGSDLYEGEFAL